MKLHVEKAHRATKGGMRPWRIQKHTPYGRILGRDEVKVFRRNRFGMSGLAYTLEVQYHATKGPRVYLLRRET